MPTDVRASIWLGPAIRLHPPTMKRIDHGFLISLLSFLLGISLGFNVYQLLKSVLRGLL